MRHLLHHYLDGRLSRRGFLGRLVATGFTVAAARSIVEVADVEAQPEGAIPRYTVGAGTGGHLLVEQIRAAGTKYIFTNPGSFEVGFFDALTDRPELQVIMGLHEGIVIAMADGYHRVTGEPAVVNVHAIAGTAQMAGQLYNAHVDGSALVVTAGMLDHSLYNDDIRLGARPGFSQTDVNRQFTQISWEVRNGASIPVITRRAFKMASTPPGGPVYACYSTVALETAHLEERIWPRENFMIEARPRPSESQVWHVAKALIEADRPIILFGDEIWKAGAQAAAVQLCEKLGLPASTDFYSDAFCNYPIQHPQYVGLFSNDRPYPNGHADLIVQCGTRRDLGRAAVPEKPLVAASARRVAAGLDANLLGRTQPLDLAVVADVRETLRGLNDAIDSIVTAQRLQKIREARLAIVKPYVAGLQAKVQEQLREHFNEQPIHPDRVGYEVDQAIDADAIIVSENLGGSNQLFRLGFGTDAKWWFKNSGHSLGWGVAAAIGAKLGAPDRQVVLSIGDGSVMYSAAGFWSMARYSVPVLTIVWNNYNYQTVRKRFAEYGRRMAQTGRYHGMYLGAPEIDFVKLGESQGVPGEKVTTPAEIGAALKRGIEATRAGSPYLVEIVIARVGAGAESTWHQTFSLAAQRNRMV